MGDHDGSSLVFRKHAGQFQTQALSLWVGSGTGGISWWEMAGSRLFALIFPNFQIYSVTDSALNGQTIPLSLFGSLALITLGYFVFHMTLAAWLFRKKEF